MESQSAAGRADYAPPPHQAEVDKVLAAIRAEAAAASASAAPAPTAAPAPAPASATPARPAATPRPGLFRPPPPRPERSAAEIDHRIAEELEYAARHLEAIGAALVADPAFLNRHGATLQAVDLVNQNLRHLAAVIASADKDAAVGRISLQELRRRLTRKSIRTPDA